MVAAGAASVGGPRRSTSRTSRRASSSWQTTWRRCDDGPTSSPHDLPELDPTPLDADELKRVEPGLASDLGGLLLRTGYPIPPEAATTAMADRAGRAGAELRLSDAVLAVGDRRETGRVDLASGTDVSADSILLAAGPWTPQLADPSGAWRPLRPTYGVTVQLEVEPARHVLEEGAVHTVNRPVEEDSTAAIASTFSMVSVDGVSTVGSTFLAGPPDPDRLAPILVTRGARFVPALRDSPIVRARVCARPQSLDGRPFIGSLPGRDGLFVCVGHGPWGISTGPASARMAVDAILNGDEEQIAPELRAARAAGPST